MGLENEQPLEIPGLLFCIFVYHVGLWVLVCLQEMCLLDLSKTRTLAELSAGCFENPHWHPESEWKEWKESESELTGNGRGAEQAGKRMSETM